MSEQELLAREKKNARPFLATGLGICLLATVSNLLWGSAFPCIKIGYRLFSVAQNDPFSQILFAGLRFTLAGILTVLLGSIGSRRALVPKRGSLRMIVALSLFQTIFHYTCFYLSLANTTGVKGSIISATNVFISILISVLVLRMEKPSARKLLGCVIGFAGVVVINLAGGELGGGMKWTGEGLMLLAASSNAISTVLTKRFSAFENPVTLSGYQFILGGIVLSITGLLGGGTLHATTPAAYGMLVYMGFLSAVAYSIWGLLLKYNPVSRISIFGCMNPVFGVLLSALLLGEGAQAFTWQALLALMLVCLGIVVVNRDKKSVPEEQTRA